MALGALTLTLEPGVVGLFGANGAGKSTLVKILLGLLGASRWDASARERTADVLRHVGPFEERYRPMGGYPTGMKQCGKLAQALVQGPRLLLLDEPTNGLDPAGRDEMLELIRRSGTARRAIGTSGTEGVWRT